MRLLVSHHSVLSKSTRVGGHYHYSLLWFVSSSNSPSFGSSSIRKNSCMVIVSKWHSKISYSSNTFPTTSQTTVVLRYTILYHRDPLATDNGSRKHSKTLKCRPRGNNEVKDVTVRGVPDRCGREMRNK